MIDRFGETMIELEKWTRASNYIGEDLSDYYIVCGQHRDSNYADQSNFIVATDRLGGESEDDEDPKKVIVAHFGSWLVGWSELLMVHESAEDKLGSALDVVNEINDNMILDWDHYSELKSEPVKNMVDEIKKDIADGNAKYWSCYGITGNETDEEIREIADDHIN
jgi:hypothetical protein